jgi:pyruvate formate lyase activating enzyme
MSTAVLTAPATGIQGHVHSIETCGTVDGPGTRYVLFLSGCPLRCQYCHNPDTRGRSGGTLRTVDEVADDVLRYRNFIRRGGLTISGGEPLMQPDFVRALFQKMKAAGIHTTLDTSGFLGDAADDELLAATDLVLLDIKSGLPETYREVTGVALEPTLRFAKRLDALGKPVWIRFVVVPGLTDALANIRAVAEFVAGLGNVARVEILPFHQFGRTKYAALGMPYPMENTRPAGDADVARARIIFADAGVDAL